MNTLILFIWTILPDVIFDPVSEIVFALLSPTGLIITGLIIVIVVLAIILIRGQKKKKEQDGGEGK